MILWGILRLDVYLLRQVLLFDTLAIIGVLVAVSIPVFTSQLEKAREAVDEANIRSLYAECAATALTAADAGTEGNITIAEETDGSFTCTATYTMTQQKAGLTGRDSIEIGGVVISSDDFKLGTATITVKSDGTTPTISISK